MGQIDKKEVVAVALLAVGILFLPIPPTLMDKAALRLRSRYSNR